MATSKPKIVGLYGVPGSGKTYLKDELKSSLDENQYAFYDGSEILALVTDGSLDSFKQLPEREKSRLREAAIRKIASQCAQSGKIGVVTGHLMFWAEAEAEPTSIDTPADLETYTHIVYLDVSAERVRKQRREHASRKDRADDSVKHIKQHMQREMTKLRELCVTNRIFFTSVQEPRSASDDQPFSLRPAVARLLTEFVAVPAEEIKHVNTARALSQLDEQLRAAHATSTPNIMLVLDADKTLGPHDTGKMFWDTLPNNKDPLNDMFKPTNFGYSDAAFQQAMLYYEQYSPETFLQTCKKVAKTVSLYKEVETLLKKAASCNNVGVVVVTCGLRRVWELVLQRDELTRDIVVIGGGQLDNGYFVSPDVKAAIVQRLQQHYHTHVIAIGDSPLDIKMLQEADESLVVVGAPNLRSRSMEAVLTSEVAAEKLDRGFRQVLLPNNGNKLQVKDLQVGTLAQLHLSTPQHWSLELHNAGDKNAAKILMSATRDATVSGRALQEAHRKIGWYLATQYLPDLIGLESFKMSHVQGGYTAGHRLHNENKTTIIALMRGGEPMAFGVHDAFPQAKFLHASQPSDIKLGHIQGQENIIVVDSVINSGKSIADHVNHIRTFNLPARIVIIAGVVQEQAIQKETGGLTQALLGYGRLSIVALRTSANKYTGRGGTDTGNRLFNTTNLD
ncbi:hypothetical protein CB0940_04674 [Cercospora beticola]|uniref:Phosphoribosyltransferase domain-containing protein n=1 Tax=Cercospora beticola TaxID=122368 RepID=A0A2G5HM91_CERBT|nr:hypothetical protein CB0940_04674 [Cercospora beticola]PIA93674.1 hypothetical protein CB0940_04674 [Cercospora beticola]WPB01934.1 hypothetical protein RHO25_006567 [Cercospora beticola]